MTDRYNQSLHAMQSGVAYDPDPDSQSPKHLRVGINARAADQAGLVSLLIEKGVFTLDEYLAALEKSMENEVKRYEAYLENRLGRPVTLK